MTPTWTAVAVLTVMNLKLKMRGKASMAKFYGREHHVLVVTINPIRLLHM